MGWRVCHRSNKVMFCLVGESHPPNRIRITTTLMTSKRCYEDSNMKITPFKRWWGFFTCLEVKDDGSIHRSHGVFLIHQSTSPAVIVDFEWLMVSVEKNIRRLRLGDTNYCIPYLWSNPPPRIPVTNEGLGWDSLLKMFHNPGGHDCILGGGRS